MFLWIREQHVCNWQAHSLFETKCITKFSHHSQYSHQYSLRDFFIFLHPLFGWLHILELFERFNFKTGRRKAFFGGVGVFHLHSVETSSSSSSFLS